MTKHILRYPSENISNSQKGCRKIQVQDMNIFCRRFRPRIWILFLLVGPEQNFDEISDEKKEPKFEIERKIIRLKNMDFDIFYKKHKNEYHVWIFIIFKPVTFHDSVTILGARCILPWPVVSKEVSSFMSQKYIFYFLRVIYEFLWSKFK